MPKFQRPQRSQVSIPTASMADIAFLLLIFFTVTTTFRPDTGLRVNLPRAEAGEKQPVQDLVDIYIDSAGTISIDDKLISIDAVEPILTTKLARNPRMVVGLKFDRDVPFRTVQRCLDQMRQANARNTSFTVQDESR